MKQPTLPMNYIGREQAYIKHRILQSYLVRLFMIVGQKSDVINYVDCFSGPWQEGDESLGDTSIGISLEQMSECQKTIQKHFNRNVRFRALYIEKQPEPFYKLKSFLESNPYSNIETKCIKGAYSKKTQEIVDWCDDKFTFFFIDPTGWISIKKLKPLLKIKNCEFLINLMYDFINRFVNIDDVAENISDIFGEVPQFSEESPAERQSILLGLFRKNLNQHYNGRTTYIPIEKPGQNRVHYYLVYLTRHSRGVDVFKTAAEKMDIVQRITHKDKKLRQQIKKSNNLDMFGVDSDVPLEARELVDNSNAAKRFLLEYLSNGPVLLDIDRWANFLEETDLYPTDFQLAMKELVKAGTVVNLDTDVSKRRTKIIKPDWPNKSERWAIAKDFNT